jgi:hypothetical protein
VRKCQLLYQPSVLLLAVLPVFGTIAPVQNNAKWNSGAATTCVVTLTSAPVQYHLLVVWTYWKTSTANTLTASVSDSQGNGIGTPAVFPSAVGPTTQSASDTVAQIFYVVSNGNSGSYQATVLYSGSGPNVSSGCVVAEYSGTDPNYPLDSVSAGYSTSGNPTSLLDSGTVAPANSNLLLFAGGVSDSGTANAGTGFTGIQSHNFSSGMAITEQNSSTITGNNVLQRATVCLSDVSCLAPSGNWVMQMAVFRDASWTVSNAWSPSRIGQVRHANLFPGGDIGAQINNAYADCPANGCHIKVDAGTYSFTTPILFGTLGKPAWLECDPGATVLTYTLSSGNAVTLNWGYYFTNVNVAVAHPGVFGCVIRGTGTSSSWGSAIGITDGSNSFGQGDVIDGVTIQGFNAGFQFTNSGTFLVHLTNSIISFNNYGVKIESDNTEKNHIDNNNISGNVWGIYFDTPAQAGDWYIDNNSLDSNGLGAAGVVTTSSSSGPCTSNCVAWVSGTTFNTLWTGTIMINGSPYTIATVYNNMLLSVMSPGPGSHPNVSYSFSSSGAFYVSSSGLNNYLQINFDDNHVEDNLSGAVLDILQVFGGTVNMHGDEVQIDHTAGGPYAENILVSGSAAVVNLENVQMHSYGTCGSSPCVTTLATFNSQAMGSLKNVTITSGTGMTPYSAATGTQVTNLQLAYPQISMKATFGLTSTIGTGNGNSNLIVSSGGSTSGIVLQPGSAGLLLNGMLSNYGISGGTTTAYTSTIPISTQVAGTLIFLQMHATNGGGSTLAVNGMPALQITKNGHTALAANDLLVNEIVPLMSDGSYWQIIGAAYVP